MSILRKGYLLGECGYDLQTLGPTAQVGEVMNAFLEQRVERMLRSAGARPLAPSAAGAALGPGGRAPPLPLLRLKVCLLCARAGL